MNPRSSVSEADALHITPSRRLPQKGIPKIILSYGITDFGETREFVPGTAQEINDICPFIQKNVTDLQKYGKLPVSLPTKAVRKSQKYGNLRKSINTKSSIALLAKLNNSVFKQFL